MEDSAPSEMLAAYRLVDCSACVGLVSILMLVLMSASCDKGDDFERLSNPNRNPNRVGALLTLG